MAVDAQNGSIDILLNYKDNLDTVVANGKKKIQSFTNEVVIGIDKLKEVEASLAKLVEGKTWDGRLKVNRELQVEYKKQLEILQQQRAEAANYTNIVGTQLVKYNELTGKMATTAKYLDHLSKGKVLDTDALMEAIKLVSHLSTQLNTAGSEVDQLARKSGSLIKTYGEVQAASSKTSVSISSALGARPSKPLTGYGQYNTESTSFVQADMNSSAQVNSALTNRTYYDKLLSKVESFNTKLNELHQANLAEEEKYVADIRKINEQEFNEYIKQTRREEELKLKEANAKDASQRWFERSYVDDSATTKYKDAVAKLKTEVDSGRITVEQYNTGLAEEKKRLDAVKESADAAATTQRKLNAETRDQQLKSFKREYESTPAQNQFNDALEKLNRLKKDGIITQEQYTAAVNKEDEARKAAHTTAQLSYKQRAEGFRVIDGEVKQLRGLTLQYHDLKEAMVQADAGSTFGKKVGTTMQYMAAGAGIYTVVSALYDLGSEFVKFDTFSRTAAAALDTTTAKSQILGTQLIDLGTRLGGTNSEIQNVAMELGRAGVSIDNISKATEVVIKMARLTGDSFETSSKAIIAYQTVFGETYNIDQLGDKLATVANASRLTTHDIGTFSNYALAASQTVGLSIDTLGAMAAAFSNAGVNASTSGTSVRRFGTMLTSTDKEIVNFFNSLGVNQKNMLMDMTSSVAKSNETMTSFIKNLGNVSDEEFQKMISGMDILAANTLTMMRNNASEITRLIQVSASESEGMLANTDTIIASYAVTWERTWNNLVSIVIGALQSVSGTWLPRFLSNAVDQLGEFSALAKDIFDWSGDSLFHGQYKRYEAVNKENRVKRLTQQLEDAKAAGDYRKQAELTLQIQQLIGKEKQREIDGVLLSIQLQREKNLELLKSGKINKDQWLATKTELDKQSANRNKQLKDDPGSYKNANEQMDKLSKIRTDILGHEKEISRIKTLGARASKDELDTLNIHNAAVSKLKSEYAGVVAQVNNMGTKASNDAMALIKNTKDINALVQEFNVQASSGLVTKSNYDYVKSALSAAYDDAVKINALLNNPELGQKARSSIKEIINSNTNVLTMREKISKINVIDPKEQNLLRQIVDQLGNAYNIKSKMLQVDKAYANQNKKSVAANKKEVNDLDKETKLLIEKKKLDDEIALYQKARSSGEISKIDQLQIGVNIAAEELQLIENSVGLKDKDLVQKRAQLALDRALYELQQAQNAEAEKESKRQADILMSRQKIDRLLEQVNLKYVSEVDLAQKELGIAINTEASVYNTTKDEQKKLEASEKRYKAQLDLNTAKQKENELILSTKRELQNQQDIYNNTNKLLTQGLLTTKTMVEASDKPNNWAEHSIAALSEVISISRKASADGTNMGFFDKIQQFYDSYKDSINQTSSAINDYAKQQRLLNEAISFEAKEKQRAVDAAQKEYDLVKTLVEITNKNPDARTKPEQQLLVQNGIRTENDLRQATTKLLAAQTAQLQEQAGIQKEYNAIIAKDFPLLQVQQYNIALAEIQAKMEGVAGWTEDMSKKVALERTKTDWDRYVDGMKDSTKQLERVVQSAFSKMEDSIIEFATTGKLNFSSFVESVLQDLLRMQIQMNLTAPLAEAMKGFSFSSLFSSGTPATSTPAVDVTAGAIVVATGGLLPTKKFAYGGKLYGGTGFKDDLYLGSAAGSHVFAMGGEYILNRSATQSIGSTTLDYMNKTGQVPVATTGSSVVVNIENKSGQPMTAEKMSEYTRQNDRGEQEKVINFVIDGVNRNINGARDVLKGLR